MNIIKDSFHDFKVLSQLVGSDLDLIQGQGGNSSLKIGNELHIKASGMRMIDSLKEDIFVTCDISLCKKAYKNRNELDAINSVISKNGLRPSIETFMHSILPKSLVVHFHCVNLLALSSTVTGKKELNQKLAALQRKGLKVASIEYAKPGLCVAEAMHASGLDADIFLLLNHGVVIQADNISEFKKKFQNYLEVFCSPPFTEISIARKTSIVDDTWMLIEGTDVIFTCELIAEHQYLRKTVFYPDHAVILGDDIESTPRPETDWYISTNDKVIQIRKSKFVSLLPMIECLIRVFSRLREIESGILSLNKNQVQELLNWDAEKYRIEINK